jgi:hypothetical protein
MSSGKLDRNVLSPRKVVKKRQLIRRCLDGRRTTRHEPERALAPGCDVQGKGEADDYKGGLGDDGGKLPTRPADIPPVY